MKRKIKIVEFRIAGSFDRIDSLLDLLSANKVKNLCLVPLKGPVS